MYTVYVIKSINKKFTYVGFTNNLGRRLFEHNAGLNKSTRPYLPFKLIYTEIVETSQLAREREKYFKSGSGRDYLRNIGII